MISKIKIKMSLSLCVKPIHYYELLHMLCVRIFIFTKVHSVPFMMSHRNKQLRWTCMKNAPTTIGQTLVTFVNAAAPLSNTHMHIKVAYIYKHAYSHGRTHTDTHRPSSQYTWKLHPLPPLLILLPPSPPLPLPRSVWRWQSRLPNCSPLLRWECFSFLLFWSADLILARILHVARCSLSISKYVFRCACLCVCTCMRISVFAPLRASVYIGVLAALLTSMHTIANVSVYVKDCPNCHQGKREMRDAPPPKTSYKAPSTQNNACSITCWSRQLYNTKCRCIQSTCISDGTERAILLLFFFFFENGSA